MPSLQGCTWNAPLVHDIAAVIAALGGAKPTSALLLSFEEAGRLVESRRFAEILQGKQTESQSLDPYFHGYQGEGGEGDKDNDDNDNNNNNNGDDERMSMTSEDNNGWVDDGGVVDTDVSLKQGKRVLVKSKTGELLYDARISDVHRVSEGGEGVGVKVHYNK